MNTADYIKWVQRRTGNQTTDEEMRVLVNLAQNDIFSFNTYFNKKKPESACYIDTTLGIKQYSPSDTQIRSIERVWFWNAYNQREDVAVQVDNAVEVGDSVTIYFKDDPGTTTEEYYFDAYLWPFNGQVTSTSVPLSLPEKVQINYLFYKVSKMLEVDKDGRSIFNEEEEQKYMRDYFTFANQGAELEPTIPDECGV